MKCLLCGRGFRDNERVMPVMNYVVNDRRGDFVMSQPAGYAHFKHLSQESEPAKAWFDPGAMPRFVGCEHYCRDAECESTNWGGTDRVHQRYNRCPPPVNRHDAVCPVCIALDTVKEAS